VPATVGTGYVVCAPMLIEQAAVVAGLRGSGVRVERTGMGRARSARWARGVAGGGPVILLGVAGGVAAEVEPGDVIVAAAVSADGVDEVPCAAATEVAEAIRRLGLRTREGRIASCATLAAGTELVRRAQSGALAVDMESAYVAAEIGSRPLVVVRVITDTATQPILRPSIVVRGVRALRTLRRIARTLPEWAGSIEASHGG